MIANQNSAARTRWPLGALPAALREARFGIFTMAATYAIAVLLGMAMVHSGNQFALARCDKMVKGAQSSRILREYRGGHLVRAALLDFSANVFVGALPSTLSGYWAPAPYPIAFYRGWVGGIVSVNGKHQTRLKWEGFPRGEGFYYVSTMILQLVPYSLAGGAGVMLGLARVRRRGAARAWFGVPVDAIKHAAVIYALIVPLFLLASIWEFLSPLR